MQKRLDSGTVDVRRLRRKKRRTYSFIEVAIEASEWQERPISLLGKSSKNQDSWGFALLISVSAVALVLGIQRRSL